MPKDSMTTTCTTRTKTMTQKYAPAPMLDNETAGKRLEKAKADYLEKRHALEEGYSELEEMKATLADHRKQAETANRQAEAAIRAAKGKETDASIEFQEMAIRKERQIRVVEGMVADQEPAVELLKIDTYGARISYLQALGDAKLCANHEAAHHAAQALASGDAAQALADALPLLTQRAEDELYGNAVYMGTYGVSLVTPTPEAGRSMRAYLNGDDVARLKADLRLHRMAAIGELMAMYLPDPGGAASGSDLEEIAPMACELPADAFPNGVAVSRRRAELVATVKSRAA